MSELVRFPRPAQVPAGWTYDVEVGGVIIGTPAYMGTVHCGYMACLNETKALLASRGIPVGHIETTTESLIQRARDRIAAQFLSLPNASHLIFIDADIEWKPEDILRLLTHDVDVICGIYPKKCDKPIEDWSLVELDRQIAWLQAHRRAVLGEGERPAKDAAPARPAEWPFHYLADENGISPRDDRTGKIEIASAPTGFLCLKRQAFYRMAAHGVVKKIRSMQGIGDDVLPWLYDWFPVEVDDQDGILWSEDYNFCRLYRQTGGRIWLDPAIRLRHIGHKAYDGDPATIFEEIEPAQPASEAA